MAGNASRGDREAQGQLPPGARSRRLHAGEVRARGVQAGGVTWPVWDAEQRAGLQANGRGTIMSLKSILTAITFAFVVVGAAAMIAAVQPASAGDSDGGDGTGGGSGKQGP